MCAQLPAKLEDMVILAESGGMPREKLRRLKQFLENGNDLSDISVHSLGGFWVSWVAHHCNKRWLEVEPMLIRFPLEAVNYSSAFMNGERWIEAEPFIEKHGMASALYSIKHFRSGWPEAEPYIATNAAASAYYAEEIIGSRWEPGEHSISESGHWSFYYAMHVLGDRFHQGEAAIQKKEARWEAYCNMFAV